MPRVLVPQSNWRIGFDRVTCRETRSLMTSGGGKMSERVTIAGLRQQVADLEDRFPKLSDDNLFVLWYLSAMLVDDEKTAAESLVGGPADKGVDAVFVDDDTRSVFV